jgi:hypothetical protein
MCVNLDPRFVSRAGCGAVVIGCGAVAVTDISLIRRAIVAHPVEKWAQL